MKLKKLMMLSVVCLSAGMTLASCGETDVPVVDVGVMKEKTEISIWTTIGTNNRPSFNRYIEKFKEIEPNITVTPVFESSNYTAMATKAISGFTTNNYPDLIQVYPDSVADFINYDKAVDLNPYIENSEYGWTAEDKTDFGGYLNEGNNYMIDGTYSVPFTKSTEALYYNKAALIGLDLSKVDATINSGNPLTEAYIGGLTWEELFDKLCPAIVTYNAALPEDEKLIKTKDNAYSAVFAYDSDDNMFITLAEQYGYKYTSVKNGKGSVDFNNAEMKALGKKWNEYAQKGYIISKGSAGGKYTNEFFTKQGTLFSIGSTGGAKYQFSKDNPMDVGVALIPQAAGKTKKVINQGPSLGLLDHGDENRKLASWLFYKYLTNKENSVDWAMNSGYNAIRTTAAEDPEVVAYFNERNSALKTLDRLLARNATYANTVIPYLFTSATFKGSSACRTQAGALMTKILTKKDGGAVVTDAELDTWFSEAEATATIQL